MRLLIQKNGKIYRCCCAHTKYVKWATCVHPVIPWKLACFFKKMTLYPGLQSPPLNPPVVFGWSLVPAVPAVPMVPGNQDLGGIQGPGWDLRRGLGIWLVPGPTQVPSRPGPSPSLQVPPRSSGPQVPRKSHPNSDPSPIPGPLVRRDQSQVGVFLMVPNPGRSRVQPWLQTKQNKKICARSMETAAHQKISQK